jgi:hypothetical protein
LPPRRAYCRRLSTRKLPQSIQERLLPIWLNVSLREWTFIETDDPLLIFERKRE